jgi:RNA polymerase sigma factor (sigma-70 family)
LALLVALKTPQAFAALAYKINAQLNFWLRKWIQNKQDLEDIRQEILLKLVLALEAGKFNGGSFYAWLFKMVKSEAMDFIRKCKMKFADVEPWHTMVDTGTEPALALEAICRKTEAAIEKLSANRRAIFKERIRSEKTFAEIGQEQGGKSASTISSAYIKARDTIRESVLSTAQLHLLKLREKNFQNEDAKRYLNASI